MTQFVTLGDADVQVGLHEAIRLQQKHDPYTRRHSQRAKRIAMRTAEKLGMSRQEAMLVGLAAMLHDLGKIAVPPEILHKPGPLTDEEWRVMRLHPVHGARIVGQVESLRVVTPFILHHHERFDGAVTGKHRGYPAGLKGDEIPLGARIIAVVDAFDAMTSDRVYRKGMPADEALAELRRHSGTQFDPQVVDAFERAVAEKRQWGQPGAHMRFAEQLEHPYSRRLSNRVMRFAAKSERKD